jgi:hypothetical protein
VDSGLLIRVRVLSNLLVDALQELDPETLPVPQLLEQLREVGSWAAEELDQLASSGRE